MKIRGPFIEDERGEVWVDRGTRMDAAADIARFRATPFAGYERPRVVCDAALALQVAVAPGVPLTLKRFLENLSCFELLKADWFHRMAELESKWRKDPEPPEVDFVFDLARTEALLCEARAQLLDFMAEDPADDFRSIRMLFQRSHAAELIAGSLASRSRMLHPDDARALVKYVRSSSIFGMEPRRDTTLGEAIALFGSAAPTLLDAVRMLAKVEAEFCRNGVFFDGLGLFAPSSRPRAFSKHVTVHAVASAACEFLAQFIDECIETDLEADAELFD